MIFRPGRQNGVPPEAAKAASEQAAIRTEVADLVGLVLLERGTACPGDRLLAAEAIAVAVTDRFAVRRKGI